MASEVSEHGHSAMVLPVCAVTMCPSENEAEESAVVAARKQEREGRVAPLGLLVLQMLGTDNLVPGLSTVGLSEVELGRRKSSL